MSLQFVNIPKWIKENKKDFLPPVCNKMMHGDGQLKIFYVGGPNVRKDFHLEEGEELFYMVKGDMKVITLEKNKFKDVIIKEGEVFLLPGRIPHSPQRVADTVGLVIERERLKEEKDCLRYFVEGSSDALFEKWFYCNDLGTELGPVIKAFFASEQQKTGKPIPGDITKDPPWVPDCSMKLEDPFSLSKWIDKNRKQIEAAGSMRLFDKSYQSDIIIVGPSSSQELETYNDIEVWIWQIEGESEIETEGKKVKLTPDDSYLVGKKVPFKHIRPQGCIAMSVKMDPKRNSKLGKKC